MATSIAIVGCSGTSNTGPKYKAKVATIAAATPAELKKWNSMSYQEAARLSVQQLIREGDRLLDEIGAVVKVKHDDPATACPAVRRLDGKIDDLDDVVGNLEGIPISARTRGVAILRHGANYLRAQYNIAAQACTDLGYYVRH
jgi:hypothetical protein